MRLSNGERADDPLGQFRDGWRLKARHAKDTWTPGECPGSVFWYGLIQLPARKPTGLIPQAKTDPVSSPLAPPFTLVQNRVSSGEVLDIIRGLELGWTALGIAEDPVCDDIRWRRRSSYSVRSGAAVLDGIRTRRETCSWAPDDGSRVFSGLGLGSVESSIRGHLGQQCPPLAPGRASRARYTSPIPPAPMGTTIS
jgi:hypothetical protein